MKVKTLLMLLFFIPGLNTLMQGAEKNGYIPLVEPGKTWSCFYEHGEFSNRFIRYRIGEADTIIAGKSYKKIYQFGEAEFDITTAFCFGGIREEGKRVYVWCDPACLPAGTFRKYQQLTYRFFDFSPNEKPVYELLMADFNLEKGDDVSLITGLPGTTVVTCDTVEVGGLLRKRITSGSFTWIEGLGFDHGLLAFYRSPCDCKGQQYLSAVEESGRRFYIDRIFPNDVFIGCPFVSIGNQWYYGTSDPITQKENYIRYECTGKETIAGKECFIIESNRSPAGTGVSLKRYLREEGGIWYQYIETTDEFTPLYNFRPIIPTLEEDINAGKNIWTVNDRLGDIQVDFTDVSWSPTGDNLFLIEWMTNYITTRNQQEKELQSCIIENIGDHKLLFYPDMFDATETFTGLRCFYQPQLGWYTFGNKACDYSSSIPANEMTLFNIKYQEGHLRVSDPQGMISVIELIGSNGVIASRFISHDGAAYPFTAKGIWLYKLMLTSGMTVSGKLIID